MKHSRVLDDFLLDEQSSELRFSQFLFDRAVTIPSAVFLILLIVFGFYNPGVFIVLGVPIIALLYVLTARSHYQISTVSGTLDESARYFGITTERMSINLNDYAGIAKIKFSGYKKFVHITDIPMEFSASDKDYGYRLILFNPEGMRKYELETVHHSEERADELMERWSKKLKKPIINFAIAENRS
jgi:hypothetical protein